MGTTLKSLRLSDDIISMIEQQPAETFTAKFELLVTKCYYELPEKQKQLKLIDEELRRKRTMLQDLSRRTNRLISTISNIETLINQTIRELDKP